MKRYCAICMSRFGRWWIVFDVEHAKPLPGAHPNREEAWVRANALNDGEIPG